jgi:hypothetical protein
VQKVLKASTTGSQRFWFEKSLPVVIVKIAEGDVVVSYSARIARGDE